MRVGAVKSARAHCAAAEVGCLLASRRTPLKKSEIAVADSLLSDARPTAARSIAAAAAARGA